MPKLTKDEIAAIRQALADMKGKVGDPEATAFLNGIIAKLR